MPERIEIPWLASMVAALEASAAQRRAPHAVLVQGAPGSGKRALAAWMARQRLALPRGALPTYPSEMPEHADLHVVRPPEDKQTIGIDQIRALVAELGLTSYEGGGKVAVIEPADLMTHNAANSLLKTLEEPPGDTLLILVADRVGRLPATIFSRCQRLVVPLPDEIEATRWLQSISPGANWARALAEAGNAPLAAIAALERLEETDTMARELERVATGTASPLGIAAKWAKSDPQFVLGWLGRQVQRYTLRAAGAAGPAAAGAVSDSVLKRIDRRKLFCYLDIINRLRGQPAGSFNVQLTLECLLIDWAQGLESVTGSE